MAKHPHKLMLLNKKTWRCAIEGCSFFVHLGLAHVLIGKTGICWICGDQYTIDARALDDELPRCIMCRTDRISPMDLDEFIELQRKKKQSTPAPVEPEKDEIEVIAEHAADCESFNGGDCTCGI